MNNEKEALLNRLKAIADKGATRNDDDSRNLNQRHETHSHYDSFTASVLTSNFADREFKVITAGGRENGPLDESLIKDLYSKSSINKDTLVHVDSLNQWLPLKQVFQIERWEQINQPNAFEALIDSKANSSNPIVDNVKNVDKPSNLNAANQPFRLKNVHYYGDSFAGDLVITTGVIYYFPTRDLMEERERAAKRKAPGFVGAFIELGRERSRERKNQNLSYLDRNNLWKPEEGETMLRNRFDDHMTELKSKERQLKEDYIFSSYASEILEHKLPFPMRFEANALRNIKLFSNSLYFETVADKHDFYVGASNIKFTAEALRKAGFIKA